MVLSNQTGYDLYEFLVVIPASYMISLVSYKDRTKKSSMDNLKSNELQPGDINTNLNLQLSHICAIFSRLKELHLYHCMLTRSCSTGFDSLLRGGISATLTILSLNFNHFMGNPEVLMAIANCQALEELYLYNAQIMSRNSSSLKQILQQNEKLKLAHIIFYFHLFSQTQL